jgi:hypothetical protein
LGNVEVGDAKAGNGGTAVRDINTESGGSPAGFTFDLTLGYQITPKLAIEGAFTFGGNDGYVETGYEESKTFQEKNSRRQKKFTDHDKVAWGGPLVAFDIGAIYALLPPKNTTNSFYINGKLAVGILTYIHAPDKAGGLRYAKISGWYAGENPGADYTSTYLLKAVEGFYLKPGFDFGVKYSDTSSFFLNVHAKIFPAAFEVEQEAVMSNGGSQRTVTLVQPMWIIPNVTLGLKYYF